MALLFVNDERVIDLKQYVYICVVCACMALAAVVAATNFYLHRAFVLGSTVVLVV